MMDPRTAHPYAITGTASSIIANRVSYFYDFRGPSVAVDTACSSSLVAVHSGVAGAARGEADVVIAGGVNALVTPAVTLGFDEVGGVLAPDGRIKSFSADADGYARSEGGGMLVLKRLADARRDGDESSPSSPAVRSTTTAGPTGCSPPTPTPRPRCCARPTTTPGSTRAPSTTSRRTAPAPCSATRSRPTRWAASSAAAAPPTGPLCWAR